MRTDKEGRTFVFHGSLLGVGALLGVLWVTIKFSGIDWATQSATHALLFNEAFAVALAACGISWCVALAVRKPKAEGRAGLPLAACCAGTALVLLGSFVMGWYFLGADVPLVAIVLAGACFGMGMLMLGFGWLAAYAAFEPATALVHAGLSFVLAGGLRYVFVTLDSAVASVAGVLALAVAAACALPLAQRAAAGQPAVTAEDEGEPCTWRQQVAQAFEMLWLPLVGAMTASFIQGLVWDPVASQTSVIDAWSVRSLSVVVGPAVGAVVIFIILGASKGAKGLRTLQQVAYPIAMAILLLYPVVGPAEGVLADVLELVPQAHPGGRDGWPRSVPGHAHGLSGAVLHLAGAEHPDREAWTRDERAAPRSADPPTVRRAFGGVRRFAARDGGALLPGARLQPRLHSPQAVRVREHGAHACPPHLRQAGRLVA